VLPPLHALAALGPVARRRLRARRPGADRRPAWSQAHMLISCPPASGRHVCAAQIASRELMNEATEDRKRAAERSGSDFWPPTSAGWRRQVVIATLERLRLAARGFARCRRHRL